MHLIVLSPWSYSKEYCPEMNPAIKETSQILVKKLETPTNNYNIGKISCYSTKWVKND